MTGLRNSYDRHALSRAGRPPATWTDVEIAGSKAAARRLREDGLIVKVGRDGVVLTEDGQRALDDLEGSC